MKRRQLQLVPSAKACGPMRARSAKHPQPKLANQTASAGSGSSAQRGERSGSATRNAATAASTPVATDASHCPTS